MPTPRRLAAALLPFFALALAARADAPPGIAFLEVKEGTLGYTLVHKLHEVKGACRAVEGRVAVLPTGAARVQVRARVACFDSGNSNRDVHMREATKEALFPMVSVKGTLDGVALPLAAPVEKPLVATVELAGQRQQLTLTLKLAPAGAGVQASFSFPISLDAFAIERPELLLVKVDDKVVIDGSLRLEAAAKAP